MAILGPVAEAHRFDEARLADYLAAHGLIGAGVTLAVEQYRGGQSNPTFRIRAGEAQLVLRKKPPGRLLPSAHLVEREYRVMKALEGTGVPVPRMLHLCEDEAVIGQAFFVMEHVEGRVPAAPGLPEVADPADRAAIYDSMNDVLARLHSVDWRAVGLGDYGKPTDYVARQVSRWTRQYLASRTGPIPSMERLIEWLPAHIPSDDETAIAHGDYRLDNLVLHSVEPRVIAVLDWELSTLGHPVADLAYNCMTYRLPEGPLWKGLGALDCESLGIPSERDYVAAYCRRTGRSDIPDWGFFMAFGLFRLASICQGVHARALQGNASAENALEVGRKAPMLADAAWAIARDVAPG